MIIKNMLFKLFDEYYNLLINSVWTPALSVFPPNSRTACCVTHGQNGIIAIGRGGQAFYFLWTLQFPPFFHFRAIVFIA